MLQRRRDRVDRPRPTRGFDDGYSSVLALAKPILDEFVAPWKKTVLCAMATYGMYFGDTGGGTWSVAIESGSTYTSFGYGSAH